MEHQIGVTAGRIWSHLDRNREAFYKRYWPGRKLCPESFHLTINTSAVSEDQLVECVLPLVVEY